MVRSLVRMQEMHYAEDLVVMYPSSAAPSPLPSSRHCDGLTPPVMMLPL